MTATRSLQNLLITKLYRAVAVLPLGLWLLAAGPALAQTAPAAPKPAKAGQRPGSVPTPPVRYISPDPRDPTTLPPPGVANPGQGRVPGANRRPVPDTLAGPAGAAADTSRLVQRVSGSADSLTVRTRRKGQVETTVKYAAKDSIQFDVTDKVARLYSKAKVDYGTTNLKAALITVNYGLNTMTAEGKLDTINHKLLDRPVFKDGEGLYTAGKIAYNFKTKKGKIIEAVTTQGEGFVSAEVIKKTPDNELYGLHGRYTTCNLEHPHFFIQASKMKVTRKQVVTGPFNLVIGDVPTPLGFLFGFFPKPNKGRGAGVLIPTFGQAADRGYYLTNGGYYFAPTDYVGIRLTGDIYAGNGQGFGGYGGTADVQYLKRYTYSGNFNFRFTNRPQNPLLATDGLSTSPIYIRPPAAQTFWLSWSHSPVAKPGGGRFSASVQAGSTSFNRVNSLDARRYLSPTFSSSISYSKQIRNSPVNYRVQLNQSQNVQTGVMDFVLPDVSLGVARQTPYQWFKLPARGRFYEQFAISYDMAAQNKLSNVVPGRSLGGLPLLGGSTGSTQIPLRFGNLGALFRNAQNGIKHNFGLTLGSYTLLKNLRLTPSVSYGEIWYNKQLSYRYVEAAKAVRIDTASGFFREYNYSGGLSLNTTFYGTVVRKNKNRFVQAIRHKATPSLNYSYSPDFTKTTSVFTDYNDPKLAGLARDFGSQYNQGSFQRYNGFLYGAPGGARVSSLSFSLQNSVELKVRNKEDTTGTAPTRKVSLIDALDFNISYNFAADSLKLSPLGVSFRRQVGKSLNLSASATFEPYQRDSTGRFRNRFLFDQAGTNRRLARLSRADLGITYSFNPATGTKRSVIPRAVAPANDPTLGTPAPPALYADYVDFTIPWELALTFNAAYSASSPPLTPRSIRPPVFNLATVGVTGAIKLTENLRLNYNLGYDLVHQTITYPNIVFFRDLHCWQIAGNWIPLGQTRGFNVTISAKSSLLQDLKLNRNRFTQYQ